MNTCPGCESRISYPPPCEICARRIQREYDERGPEDRRGLSPLDPRLFNIPNTDQDYRM